ncbi:MAG TPA: hypothetical protein VM734_11450 [Kofleriaceae bacterium]|jgi:RNA polymerase sigma-70 factor (ECF subfamily)|nr:hypothetical protein [Kofleriaceae bacterium]
MAIRQDDLGAETPDDARAVREREIRDLARAGDLQGAATAALEQYGAEIFGFLHALARDDDLAAEAFSGFSEDLWKGLPGFRWDASLRTWSYALARNALHRLRRDPRRRPRHNVPLSAASKAEQLAEQLRTQTLPFLKTEVKDEVRRLREALDPDDHALLVLRIDRKLSWRDIARAMPGDDTTDLDRRAATLRKRFERAKTMLRELASKRGLLPTD